MNSNLNFKVLAYPASNLSNGEPVSPSFCSLVFRCDDAKLATLLLFARIPTVSSADSQFVLQYDADALTPYAAKLSSGNEHLTQTQLDEILPVTGKGKKRPDIKTLDLSVSGPCPVWSPASDASFSHQPGCGAAFQAFVNLAKATTVHVVFDYSHVRKQYQGMFKAFGKAARGLGGYPVEGLLVEQGLRKGSWDVFAPFEAAGAPPAYEGCRTRKRSREASPRSPTQPPRCWTPKSPTGSHSSGKTIPFSPEVAAATLRRAELAYQTDVIHAAVEQRLAAHLDELRARQAEAIDAAVAKHLPAYFTADRHTEIVDAGISRQLNAALETLLPSAVENALAPEDPPSSPAASFTSLDSRGNRYPKLPPLTRIGQTMLPHLRTHLTAQFHLYQQQQLQRFEALADKTFDTLERAAYNDRAREHAEFEAEMEEHKTEIGILRNDTLDELWRQGDAILQQGTEVCDALGEDMNERLLGLCDRIDRLGRYKLRRLVANEVRRQQGSKKKSVPRGWGRNMLRGEHRLLGRRRQVESEESWIDV